MPHGDDRQSDAQQISEVACMCAIAKTRPVDLRIVLSVVLTAFPSISSFTHPVSYFTHHFHAEPSPWLRFFRICSLAWHRVTISAYTLIYPFIVHHHSFWNRRILLIQKLPGACDYNIIHYRLPKYPSAHMSCSLTLA